MMPFYMFYDPTYFLVLIGVILSLIASARVKSTFNKYSQMRNSRGMTGAQAAEQVLRGAGIYEHTIVHQLRLLELQHMSVGMQSNMRKDMDL